MSERFVLLAVMGLSFAAPLGCQPEETKRHERDKIVIPAFVSGTVAEYAVLSGGPDFPVQGYGLVVGLGDKGSDECPPRLERYFIDYLNKRKVGSHVPGAGGISPKSILRSLDTAVVSVGGSIPIGAPKGTRFDVAVRAMPQVESLDGGSLWPSEMRLVVGGITAPGRGSKVFAEAGGPVFVNPFIDPGEPGVKAKLREGRIIGGAEVIEARKLRLQLIRPGYDRCRFMENRINERFSYPDEKVANAIGPSTIDLRIPRIYAPDYRHFLRLVMHLSLRTGPGGQESHAREIIEAMKLPGADHNELALVWEAMGKQVIPILQSLYASGDDMLAFFAARTGLRLGDPTALKVVTGFASRDWPLQLEAISELGRSRRQLMAVPVLRELIDHDNESIRLATYEALVKHNDRALLTREEVPGQFRLDTVACTKNPVIYATQTREAKIVLFGGDIAVEKPVFYTSPDALVTVNAYDKDERLSVFRRVHGQERFSDTLKSDFQVRAFIKTLGSSPQPDREGKIRGLGLTYSQVAGVLYRMCKAGDIRAKFVLQQPPSLQRIHRRSSAVGRPDTPP